MIVWYYTYYVIYGLIMANSIHLHFFYVCSMQIFKPPRAYLPPWQSSQGHPDFSAPHDPRHQSQRRQHTASWPEAPRKTASFQRCAAWRVMVARHKITCPFPFLCGSPARKFANHAVVDPCLGLWICDTKWYGFRASTHWKLWLPLT